MDSSSQSTEKTSMQSDDPFRCGSGESRHEEDELTDATLRQLQRHHPNNTFWRRLLASLCSRSFFTTAIALVAFVVALGSSGNTILAAQSLGRYRATSLGDCGSTWQEAEQNGCVFDVMAKSWVRSECRPKKLSEDFFKAGNWTFYRDPEGTEYLSHEDLLTGRVSPYYTDGSYEFAHCSYVWHKQLRQMGKHIMLLDSESRNWHHSIDCLYTMAEADADYINDKTSSKTVVGKTKTGGSVNCIAGEWESSEKPLADYVKEIFRSRGTVYA